MIRKPQPPLPYNATLVERIDLTEKLAIFRVRPDHPLHPEADFVAGQYVVSPPSPPQAGGTMPVISPPFPPQAGGSVPDFVAGQYMVIGANNDEAPEKGSVRRSYSIASTPHEKRYLEFYVRYADAPLSENPLTHLLWKMWPGDRLYLGPRIVGRFTLAHTIGEDDARWKIFVAAGTGLAPFVSIIKTFFHESASGSAAAALEKMIILHGASRPQELGYREEMELIFNNVCQRYFPTISRPHLHPEWGGSCGRVETFFDAELLEALEDRLGMPRGEINPARAVIFVCGMQNTITQTLVRLLHRGFVPNDPHIRQALRVPPEAPPSLFFEQYDNSPILDLSNELLLEELRQRMPGRVNVECGMRNGENAECGMLNAEKDETT